MAVAEASHGIGLTSPNPAVGAVIVKDGVVLGKGWHRKAGLPHAEREAIADVLLRYSKEEMEGATIYVTLEPCSTHGRTPPCTQGILDVGISRVVYGAEDPNPGHVGAAKKILESAGVEVRTGVCEDACRDLIRGFAKVQKVGLPWVLIKSAISLDGKITRPPGEGQWLTSEESRQQVQRIRYECDAIITGGNTLRKDNPALTLRGGCVTSKEQPWRMVMTRGSADELPRDVQLFTDEYAERTLVQGDGDLRKGLERLVEKGCHTVMVEAGGRLLSAFLDAGLVDEVVVFYAPMFTGGPDWGIAGLSREVVLSDQEFSQIGDDVMMRAKVVG